MTYIRSTAGEAIAPETIQILAGLMGLTVPPEDVASLAASLRDQLAAIELLDQLDLTDINPNVEFDPRWSD